MRMPVQTRPSVSPVYAAGGAPGIHPEGIFDDIIGGIGKVIGIAKPIVSAVAPMACSMCAMIPDPMAKAACMAACSMVTG